ncbi:MAG: chorismate-binding protein, partial [Parachlamydiaceae bacterium]
MKAIFREGEALLHYHNPGRIVKTSSWTRLKEELQLGCFWAGYIPYEMGVSEACFFEAQAITPYHDAPFFETPQLECVKPFDTALEYQEKIKAIQEDILNGDVYQVNLSHETKYRGKIDTLALFLKLAHNPFAAYFDEGEKQYISSSPEKLLSRTGTTIESCPIKGTMPFGQSAALLNSAKDAAELNMITDLIRSDMSWISNIESPRLVSEKTLTSYPHVHHLHSVIEAESDLHPIECVKALFPGGSITGCPKGSALQ